MKILIALSRFPLPIDKGDKLRAYYQIKDLSKNNDLYVVCLVTKQPSAKDLELMKSYCKEIVLVRLSYLQIGINLLLSLVNSLPFQVNYFSSRSMKSKIKELILLESIDLCYVQLVRSVKNIPFGLKTRYFIDYMDSLSEGMKNRYHFSRWYEKFLVGLEYKRLKKYEEQVFSSFNGGSIITEADAEVFPEGIKRKLSIISNGVEEHFFKQAKGLIKKYDLIFTGNMAYHPNVLACKFLVKEILPILKETYPDVKICIAGTNPTKEVLDLADRNTEVTGYVPHISDYLSQSKLFVAPLFSGSGLQNKLLESMASGMPTLTSPSAAKALGARNGIDLIVCKDKKEFAEQIILLIKNDRRAEELGLKGQNYVKARFNWTECNRLLEKEFIRIQNTFGNS
jgi:glycosyltransferase involved in cell wall biosynthesis